MIRKIASNGKHIYEKVRKTYAGVGHWALHKQAKMPDIATKQVEVSTILAEKLNLEVRLTVMEQWE